MDKIVSKLQLITKWSYELCWHWIITKNKKFDGSSPLDLITRNTERAVWDYVLAAERNKEVLKELMSATEEIA